jgi:2-(3-amino-3-carboxypropyl)histidine synthase
MFDEKICEEILLLLKDKKAKRVFIQVPEGIKAQLTQLVDFLEKNDIEPFISLEPCFGACDIRENEARMLNCDVILHIGHENFGLKPKIPVIYYEYFIDFSFIPLLKKFIKKIKYRKICLVSTIQFKKSLEEAKVFLEKNGFEIKGVATILGCNIEKAKIFEKSVDVFLFIGSGRFHPLGLQLKTEKPVLFLDIERDELQNLYNEKVKEEIKRRMKLEKAKEACKFGIIVSTKQGQMKLAKAEKIKEMLNKKGKKAYIFIVDQLTPEKIFGFKIDVIVNTACPRIKDDEKQYGKIILNLEEIEEF